MSTPDFERALLRAHVDAAVDGDARDVGVIGEALDVVFDLHASSRVGARIRTRVKPRSSGAAARAFSIRLQDRQQERGGLAGAGVGAADDVVAAHARSG